MERDGSERSDETVQVDLTSSEVEVLVSLRDELDASLRDFDDDDPAVRRLFPPVVLGDPDLDRDVRALMREELLSTRLAALQELIELLERGRPHRRGVRLELVDDEPLLLLGVLNDLRLALGAWVDVDALDPRTVDDDTIVRLAIIDHLARLQEDLLGVVDPASLSHYEERDRDHDGEPWGEGQGADGAS